MIVDHMTTVGNIARHCLGTITCGDPSRIIETITTDSRELKGKNFFIPLVGEKFDGHDFIRPLSENKRIESFLTMKEGYTHIAAGNNIAEIRCADTLKALGEIAGHHRETVAPQVIAITGTNGKTTTKDLVYSVLSGQRQCLKSQKNYNNEIGVPMTLLGLKESHEFAIIEMGMNHAGELERLSRIARPDLALITNVGEGHLEFLGSMENVARAKSEIIRGMEKGAKLLVNGDMDFLHIILQEAHRKGLSVKTFGLSPSADIRLDSYKLFSDRTSVVFEGAEITVPLYGIHNAYNILAAIAVVRVYGVETAAIREALAGFAGAEGRSRIIDRGFLVIDDTYNSNPLSLTSALRSAKEIFPRRRKIAVLSDMKELGDFAKKYHTECGRAVVENGFDMLLVWGDLAKCYCDGAAAAGLNGNKCVQFNTKKELSRFLKSTIDENDVVLIKGSRSMKMDDVVHALTEREE